MFDFDVNRRLAAEFIGTAMLLAVVVGTGIMAENLAGGNVAIALLGNTIATGAILVVLILIFGSISGAHFNPAVTFAFLLRREIGKPDAAAYVTVQVGGGAAGVLVAHLMFDEPLLMLGGTERTGIGQWTGEAVATFGLVATILGCLSDTFAGIRPADAPAFIVVQFAGAALATWLFAWFGAGTTSTYRKL